MQPNQKWHSERSQIADEKKSALSPLFGWLYLEKAEVVQKQILSHCFFE